MNDDRIVCQDDLLGMTPAEIVDEVTALRARAEAAEEDRDRWKALAGRLADAMRDLGGADASGERLCWCDGVAYHGDDCLEARAALAEHTRAKREEDR